MSRPRYEIKKVLWSRKSFFVLNPLSMQTPKIISKHNFSISLRRKFPPTWHDVKKNFNWKLSDKSNHSLFHQHASTWVNNKPQICRRLKTKKLLKLNWNWHKDVIGNQKIVNFFLRLKWNVLFRWKNVLGLELNSIQKPER